jgi:hypothetical protein
MTWLGKVAPWILTVICAAVAVGVLVEVRTARAERDWNWARLREANERAALLVVERDAGVKRIEDMVTVVADLGAQVDRMRSGCPGARP